jgi:hypothetical protein
MKNKIGQVFAWVLGLLAFFSASSQSFAQTSGAPLEVRVSAKSPKRTAFIKGDYNRLMAVFEIENKGQRAATFDGISFEKSWADMQISIEIDGGGYHYSSNSGWLAYFPVRTEVPAGKTIVINVRGNIPTWSYNSFWVDFSSLNTNNVYTIPQNITSSHAVVDEIPGEGIANASVRTTVTPGEVTVMGFVVRGDEGRSYPVLIRAAGPALGRLGVQNTLDDPVVKVFNSAGNLLSENDDWNGLEFAFQEAGAFPFQKGSLDAATHLYLSPGSYTVTVKGFGAGKGGVLIEVYQLKPNDGGKG